MENLPEALLKFIEKVLTPYQVWATLMLASGILLFAPLSIKTSLGLDSFAENKGYLIGLIFLVSILALIVKLIFFVTEKVRNREHLNFSDLTDEEKAILVFFRNNNYESFKALDEYPAIRTLVSRGFIREVLSMLIVSGNRHEWFELTGIGRKKLQSERFFTDISASFINESQVLNFINAISDKQYTPHNPHRFN